jgi:hypothetical protein
MHHVAGAGFALGADHGRALGDTAQGLSEVARSTDKRCSKSVLVDMVRFVGRGEDFALIDEVDAQFLEDLRFGEVADAGLGHDRDGDSLDDLLDEAGLAMRATPPSARIIAGTRSRAITAVAPDSSAMRACSTFITSMMTPPLSISAKPIFRRRPVSVTRLVPFTSVIDLDLASRQIPGAFKASKAAYLSSSLV